MKIALAQIRSAPLDVENNIRSHDYWISRAVAATVDTIVFPELSITGYEPRGASEVSKKYQKQVSSHFDGISKEMNINILLGFPTVSDYGLHISSLGFTSQGSFIYSKRSLHSDEQPFFSPSTNNALWKWEDQKIGLGICYESVLEHHLTPLLKQKIDLYLVSVAKTAQGMKNASYRYAEIAEQEGFPVLVVNAVGACTEFTCGGQSGVWIPNGSQLIQLNSNDQALICYDTISHAVSIIQ